MIHSHSLSFSIIRKLLVDIGANIRQWYTRDREYKYIGAIMPHKGSSRFVASVFINPNSRKRKYFYQILENEKVIDFKEIRFSRDKLLESKNPQIIKNGQDMIFSFVSNAVIGGNELISGQRNFIEKQLVAFLHNSLLNNYSRLQISKFLQLYKTTFQLKEKLDQLYTIQKFSADIHVKITEVLVGNPEYMIDQIDKKLCKLKKYNEKISIEDVVFLNRDAIYFENCKLSIDIFLNRDLLDKKHPKLIISNIINTSYALKSISIRDIVGSVPLLSFTLRSEHVDIKDSLLSTLEEEESDAFREHVPLVMITHMDENIENIDDDGPEETDQEEETQKMFQKIINNKILQY
jgi:hypothetical protein